MHNIIDREGTPFIEFQCAHCTAPMESKLADAGKGRECPVCCGPFKVPGVDDLKAWLAAEKEKAARRAAEDRLKHQDRAAAAERVERERQAAAARGRALGEQVVGEQGTDYPQITAGSRIIESFGNIIIAFGVISIVAGVLLAVLPREMPTEARLTGFFVGLVNGLAFILVGVLYRMIASLAVAIRDIATSNHRIAAVLEKRLPKPVV